MSATRPTNKLVIAFMLLLYVSANIASVKVPFIPDITMLYLWGFAFPVLAIWASWDSAFKHKPYLSTWYVTPSILSLIFIFCGGSTAYYLVGLYASI